MKVSEKAVAAMRVMRMLIQGGLPARMTMKRAVGGAQPQIRGLLLELVEVLVMTTTTVTIGGNPSVAIAQLLRAKKQGRLGGEVIGALGKKKAAGANQRQMTTTAEVTTGEEMTKKWMTEEVELGAGLLPTTTTRTVGGNRQLLLGESPPHVTMMKEIIGGEEVVQRQEAHAKMREPLLGAEEVEIELVVVRMMKVGHGAGRPSMTMIGEVEAEQEIELQEMMKRHHGRQLQSHLETEVTTVIMKLAWVGVVA
mmetsp:Transcript_31545/g.84230  ORF Transcript_31545/g.84230 Transcript_31545/m.84230 type:complete len:253 (+) Transcript_31545:2714-3472(+)